MSSPGKDFRIDAVYPEHLSRLRRGSKSELPTSSSYRRSVKKQLRKGNSGRFRTQPVTFHEIKEVDEENLTETEEMGPITGDSVSCTSKSESDLKAKFELFYQSIVSGSSDAGHASTNQTESIPTSALTSTTIIAKLPSTVSRNDAGSLASPNSLPGFDPRSRPSL